ncbi:MAG: hypothetical protein COB77_04705 [Gammaproteobacteria bacterium]|nr:MAG: hypothetical protein COB77_04705 [Gammaproteobacteria bacterium]
MFGFFSSNKQRKAARRIASELHRQVRDAIKANEAEASSRVTSLFTLGYLYGLLRQGFTNQGFQGEAMAEKYFKPICKKIPGNFYKVIREQSDELEIAIEKNDKESISFYESGLNAGIHDAVMFRISASNVENNFFNYLTNQALDFEDKSK